MSRPFPRGRGPIPRTTSSGAACGAGRVGSRNPLCHRGRQGWAKSGMRLAGRGPTEHEPYLGPWCDWISARPIENAGKPRRTRRPSATRNDLCGEDRGRGPLDPAIDSNVICNARRPSARLQIARGGRSRPARPWAPRRFRSPRGTARGPHHDIRTARPTNDIVFVDSARSGHLTSFVPHPSRRPEVPGGDGFVPARQTPARRGRPFAHVERTYARRAPRFPVVFGDFSGSGGWPKVAADDRFRPRP